ncbi:P-loop containing nucleoside triphosphate hydrolase protein, partial [Fistulina hepatica ATCC 64428]
SELKKDPGIPRLPDLKVRAAEKEKLHFHVPKPTSDGDSVMAAEPTLSTLAYMAAQAEAAHPDSESSLNAQARIKEQQRHFYLRTLHKVVDESDIVILVLDARDPEGCRSRLVEEEVRRREAEGKRLVFVLNKVDLVPKDNAQAWLRYLRHSTPTLPFLSPTQQQRSNINSKTAPALMKLLKAYKPKAGSVTVGVVGYPNVGKSSLINSLKRTKVCAIAAQPGHTKDLQSVQLERGMRIIDSPGVVFDDDNYDDGKSGSKKGSVLLRNVVKVEDVEDPIAVVEEILVRTEQALLRKIYNLPQFGSTLEFLTMLALSAGKLLKGGTPDINAAARHVLTDWNHQKIPYFSVPPTVHPSSLPSLVSAPGNAPPQIAPGAENVGSVQIVSQFSKPFTLNGLFGSADAGAFGGDNSMDTRNDDGGHMGTGDDDGMAIDPDASFTSTASRKRPHSPSPSPLDSENEPMEPQAEELLARKPKRQRRNKDVPAYDAPPDANVRKHMSSSNPLNRRNMKREAKRARKRGRMLARAAAAGADGGMEVDDVDVAFTFVA